jgi:regulation of enolase protein 1 (concanavalin A-like superfamily)
MTKFYVFTFLLAMVCVQMANGQTCTAPSQCMATPGFGEAPASHICPPDFIIEEIFLEDFDGGFGVFSEDPVPVGSNDFTVSTNGDTPSFGTGPETTASCDGGSNDGEFIFLEGSFHMPGERHCVSATISLPAPSPTVALPYTMSFWYHMFGDNIGTMDIEINGGLEFTVSGQQQTQNCQPWLQGDIDVSAYAGTDIDVKICMSEGNGAISTFESDISIDHIQVFGCRPKNIVFPGWQTADIGTSIDDNCYFYDANTGEYTLTSGGNNATSSTTDNVAFSYQTLCGNGSITAKVEDVSDNGYGGVMIRESSAPGAKQASLFSNLTNVLRHESRASTNAPKTVNAFYKPNPFWLKLERQGDWVFAYYSTTGASFTYVHGVYVPMSTCVQIGLAGFTFSPTETADAVFSNISTTGTMVPYAEGDNPSPVEAEVTSATFGANLFPNPAQDRFTVQLEQPLPTNSQLVLRSGLGQQMGTRLLEAENTIVDWDISTLAPGLYYLEIHNNNQLLNVLKVIKH